VINVSAGWDEVDSDVNTGGSGENIFFSPKEGKNQIRLIKQPHRFLSHWGFGKGKEVCLKESRNDDTYCPLCEKADSPPSTRYIIMILDRGDLDDNGVAKVKIYEGGPTVFSNFKMYYDTKGVDPGSSQDGPDWIIKKTIAEPGNPLSTKYQVMPLDPTPFTTPEKKVIKEKLDEIDLTDFYPRKSVEELKAIAGDSSDNSFEVDNNDIDLDDSDMDSDLEGLDELIGDVDEDEDGVDDTGLGF
jgi:hypothetical protein